MTNLGYIVAFRFLSLCFKNNIVFLRSENSVFLEELQFAHKMSLQYCAHWQSFFKKDEQKYTNTLKKFVSYHSAPAALSFDGLNVLK